MTGGRDRQSALEGAAQRGLLKLMVKLPSVRGSIQILAARSNGLAPLLEAYDEATTMLEKLQASANPQESAVLVEYLTICSEIEGDVIRYCLEHSPSAFRS
ncbi:Hypothetical protein NGAL_HAMBI2605_65620 [Neorhizobium galegae bv. orientalis]|nr:Hypothetical protein NGAL_HAMBI2605_65620 [Neorhizobium galegae bv. orientalis]